MDRRDFLKLIPAMPLAAVAAASAQPVPTTDAETSVRLWLRAVEWEQGVGSRLGMKEKARGNEYQEILWTSYGNHFYAWPGPPDELPVYYPTPEMAWLQWREAFRAYIKDRHGQIHWLTRPKMMGPRSCDPKAEKGFAVYSAVFVEPT
jgi:hypothetical protein